MSDDHKYSSLYSAIYGRGPRHTSEGSIPPNRRERGGRSVVLRQSAPDISSVSRTRSGESAGTLSPTKSLSRKPRTGSVLKIPNVIDDDDDDGGGGDAPIASSSPASPSGSRVGSMLKIPHVVDDQGPSSAGRSRPPSLRQVPSSFFALDPNRRSRSSSLIPHTPGQEIPNEDPSPSRSSLQQVPTSSFALNPDRRSRSSSLNPDVAGQAMGQVGDPGGSFDDVRGPRSSGVYAPGGRESQVLNPKESVPPYRMSSAIDPNRSSRSSSLVPDAAERVGDPQVSFEDEQGPRLSGAYALSERESELLNPTESLPPYRMLSAIDPNRSSRARNVFPQVVENEGTKPSVLPHASRASAQQAKLSIPPMMDNSGANYSPIVRESQFMTPPEARVPSRMSSFMDPNRRASDPDAVFEMGFGMGYPRGGEAISLQDGPELREDRTPSGIYQTRGSARPLRLSQQSPQRSSRFSSFATPTLDSSPSDEWKSSIGEGIRDLPGESRPIRGSKVNSSMAPTELDESSHVTLPQDFDTSSYRRPSSRLLDPTRASQSKELPVEEPRPSADPSRAPQYVALPGQEYRPSNSMAIQDGGQQVMAMAQYPGADGGGYTLAYPRTSRQQSLFSSMAASERALLEATNNQMMANSLDEDKAHPPGDPRGSSLLGADPSSTETFARPSGISAPIPGPGGLPRTSSAGRSLPEGSRVGSILKIPHIVDNEDVPPSGSRVGSTVFQIPRVGEDGDGSSSDFPSRLSTVPVPPSFLDPNSRRSRTSSLMPDGAGHPSVSQTLPRFSSTAAEPTAGLGGVEEPEGSWINPWGSRSSGSYAPPSSLDPSRSSQAGMTLPQGAENEEMPRASRALAHQERLFIPHVLDDTGAYHAPIGRESQFMTPIDMAPLPPRMSSHTDPIHSSTQLPQVSYGEDKDPIRSSIQLPQVGYNEDEVGYPPEQSGDPTSSNMYPMRGSARPSQMSQVSPQRSSRFSSEGSAFNPSPDGNRRSFVGEGMRDSTVLVGQEAMPPRSSKQLSRLSSSMPVIDSNEHSDVRLPQGASSSIPSESQLRAPAEALLQPRTSSFDGTNRSSGYMDTDYNGDDRGYVPEEGVSSQEGSFSPQLLSDMNMEPMEKPRVTFAGLEPTSDLSPDDTYQMLGSARPSRMSQASPQRTSRSPLAASGLNLSPSVKRKSSIGEGMRGSQVLEGEEAQPPRLSRQPSKWSSSMAPTALSESSDTMPLHDGSAPRPSRSYSVPQRSSQYGAVQDYMPSDSNVYRDGEPQERKSLEPSRSSQSGALPVQAYMPSESMVYEDEEPTAQSQDGSAETDGPCPRVSRQPSRMSSLAAPKSASYEDPYNEILTDAVDEGKSEHAGDGRGSSLGTKQNSAEASIVPRPSFNSPSSLSFSKHIQKRTSLAESLQPTEYGSSTSTSDSTMSEESAPEQRLSLQSVSRPSFTAKLSEQQSMIRPWDMERLAEAQRGTSQTMPYEYEGSPDYEDPTYGQVTGSSGDDDASDNASGGLYPVSGENDGGLQEESMDDQQGGLTEPDISHMLSSKHGRKSLVQEFIYPSTSPRQSFHESTSPEAVQGKSSSQEAPLYQSLSPRVSSRDLAGLQTQEFMYSPSLARSSLEHSMGLGQGQSLDPETDDDDAHLPSQGAVAYAPLLSRKSFKLASSDAYTPMEMSQENLPENEEEEAMGEVGQEEMLASFSQQTGNVGADGYAPMSERRSFEQSLPDMYDALSEMQVQDLGDTGEEEETPYEYPTYPRGSFQEIVEGGQEEMQPSLDQQTSTLSSAALDEDELYDENHFDDALADHAYDLSEDALDEDKDDLTSAPKDELHSESFVNLEDSGSFKRAFGSSTSFIKVPFGASELSYEGFAKAHFVEPTAGIWPILWKSVAMQDLIRFSKDPLRQPLLQRLAAAPHKQCAITSFTHLLAYMGDVPTNQDIVYHIQQILMLGIKYVDFRDEILCQICKQTTANPSRWSNSRGWQAMALCVGTFTPSSTFGPFLEAHLQQAIRDVAYGVYPVEEHDAVMLGALQLRADSCFFENLEESFTDEVVRKFGPKIYVEGSEREWKDALLRTAAALPREVDMPTCINDYIDFLRSRCTLYGSCWYYVEQKADPILPREMFVAINTAGVYFVHVKTKEQLLHMLFTEICSWGYSTVSFSLVTGNMTYNHDHRLVTTQGVEIGETLQMYINRLQY